MCRVHHNVEDVDSFVVDKIASNYDIYSKQLWNDNRHLM